MNRKLLPLLIILLLALGVPMALAAQGEGPAAPSAAESEPNDTLATADPVAIGDTEAAINPVGDVDYFHLSLTAGQRIYLAALANCGQELITYLTLLDGNGNVLAQPEWWPGNDTLLGYTAPTAGNYYVRVKSGGSVYSPEELTGGYTLLVRNVPGDEPADPSAPVPIAFGGAVQSSLYAPYDFDWYIVHARPGDVIKITLTFDTLITQEAYLYLRDAADRYPFGDSLHFYDVGTQVLTYVVPFEADYVFDVSNGIFHCATRAPQPYRLTLEREALHVAGAGGQVNGVRYGGNDILARSAEGAWQIVFDGEDAGLTVPINAFEWLEDGTLLLALKQGQSLTGVGVVKPQDIVCFTPTRLGSATQGVFSSYLKGTQVGLTLIGEKIDAIAVRRDGNILVSVTGSASVPQFGGGTLNARDEDLLLLHPNGPMPATGSWSLEMDGTKYLKTFGTHDLRAATLANDIADPDYEPLYHYTYLRFGADKAYTYLAPNDSGFSSKYSAAPGDLIRMLYYQSVWGYDSYPWPPLPRASLGFPTVITSVSIGPG